MNAIEVRKLSKQYPLSRSQWTRFRHAVVRGAALSEGILALHNITLDVRAGEAFGIIGANGSGKSTFLQIVAGILKPTSGTVEVRGRLSALLELGSGFAPEFTGRQNVFLNASILGLAGEEIERRFEGIARFAEIGDFMDQPIRTWSTGMVLRLAFAVAAHIDPDILVVDEALAVGDIAFRQRCMRRIHELRSNGTTILFVSHDTTDVKALCERCLWLDRGAARALGESDEVVAEYLSATMLRERIRDRETPVRRAAAALPPALDAIAPVVGTHRYGNQNARVVGAALVTPEGAPVSSWTARGRAVLRVSFTTLAAIHEPIAGFLVRNEKGETIFGSNTARENYPLPEMAPGETHTVDFHWVAPELAPGRCFISVAVSEGTLDRFEVCDYVEDAIALDCTGSHGFGRGYMRVRCADVARSL